MLCHRAVYTGTVTSETNCEVGPASWCAETVKCVLHCPPYFNIRAVFPIPPLPLLHHEGWIFNQAVSSLSLPTMSQCETVTTVQRYIGQRVNGYMM